MNISAVEYWGPGGDDGYTELSDEPVQEGPTGGCHGHLLTGFEHCFRLYRGNPQVYKFNFYFWFHLWFSAVLQMFLCWIIYVSFFVGNPVFMNLFSQKSISSKNLFWTKQRSSCAEKLPKFLFALIFKTEEDAWHFLGPNLMNSRK